jgi:hypothetical protein
MIFSRNAVYSALFLVLNFVTVAVFYLLLGAPFIAMAQITVYAGAIMVLFLFVIMLLGAENLPLTNVLPWQKPLAALLSLILTVEAIYILFSRVRSDAMIVRAGCLTEFHGKSARNGDGTVQPVPAAIRGYIRPVAGCHGRGDCADPQKKGDRK